MNPKQHATIIVNPVSRSGKKIYSLLKKPAETFFECTPRFTERRGHAAELARDAGSGVIIVCGGDGTFNETANGVALRNDVTVAPTYGGSGCDLSRLFNIEKNPEKRVGDIYKRMVSGNPVRMRLSHVETASGSRYFVGVGDAGFGARVAGTFDRYRRLGGLGYVLGVFQTLASLKPEVVEFSADGEPFSDRSLMVMFARSRYYAGGMLVSPHSDHLSDFARLIFIKWIPKIEFPLHFPKIYSGKHLSIKYVEEREVRRVEVYTPGIPVDVEGENTGFSPCTFSITDRYISVV